MRSSTSRQCGNPRSSQLLVCSFLLYLWNHLFFLIWHPAALLLCAENSFWYQSQYKSFLDAFKQAFKSYMTIGLEKNGGNAVKSLGDWPATTNYKKEIYLSALTKVLLEYRLRASNSVLIATCL